MMLTVTLHKRTAVPLGLELAPDADGTSTIISAIEKGGLAKASGQLRPGDVLRTVNGQPIRACAEAVATVRAIRGGRVELCVERQQGDGPAAAETLRSWSDAELVLGAGAQLPFTFHAEAGQTLFYEFRCEAHDVVFKVGMAADDAGTALGRGMLLNVRTNEQSGHVTLPQGGSYQAVFDNSYSLLRSKRLGYRLALLSHAQSARRQRAELEREAARRSAEDIAFAKEADQLREEITRLHAKEEKFKKTLAASIAARRENATALAEASARLASFASV